MRTIDQALIDKTKATQPDAQLVQLTDERTDDSFLFRLPTRPEYRKFRELLADETTRATATAWLSDKCSLEGDALRTALETQPGLADTFGGELLRGVGVNVAVTVKKL